MKRREFIGSSVAAAIVATLPSSTLLASVKKMSKATSDAIAVTGEGVELTLEKAALKELSDSLRGQLLLPGQSGYDIARKVLNPSINKHPSLIVQPTGASDLMNAITFARERNLLVAVKCGGHSFSGKSTCEKGMQIDLSTFRSSRIDTDSKTAYIAGGSLLGELDHESMAHGLVTTAGTVSHTGVGGLTLGGGFGRLARRFGLALDNVKAVDIVTADGKLRHASAEQNPDLYWAVRGGGGNFGVVAGFEFNLHKMQREVIGGSVIFPLSEARNVLKFYADYAATAPDELYLDMGMSSAAGSTDGIILLHACYSGPKANAEKVLAPIRKAGKAIKDTIGPVDYVALQRRWDDTDPRSTGSYLKSGFINTFPDKLIDGVLDAFKAVPERGTSIFWQHSGGAINRVATNETAFAHRYAISNMFTTVSWPMNEDRSSHVQAVKKSWSHLEPFTHGWYANEVDEQSAAIVNNNYQGNYQRLAKIKEQYDPTNLFRLNANIKT
ncbi:MAG: FAD/FMN-containing dehydrogenase [Enterobacterales bacterium]|jgi:FAD/FMN-containing dehydrogenase